MKITFVSNYLTHHQIPFCKAMEKYIGDDFKFISTMPMEVDRLQGGWKLDDDYNFEFKSYVSRENRKAALNLINDSDIIITGSAADDISNYVYSHAKILFLFSERILKTGRYHALSPRAIRNLKMLRKKLKNARVYVLCASAYTAGDYMIFNAFKNSYYKWGYFPGLREYEIDRLVKEKRESRVKILWCGRLLDWKRCDLAISVVCKLISNKYDVSMDIVGDGPEKERLEKLAADLHVEKRVIFHGSVNKEYVRGFMEKANIFLFTSDFREGWGAVLNEAMNSGCAVVASHAAGSTPYLIKDGYNGLIFKNGSISDLYGKTKRLVADREYCENIGINAYGTIKNIWNADEAAKRFLKLCECTLRGNRMDIFKNGPCSKASFLSNHWYRRSKWIQK